MSNRSLFFILFCFGMSLSSVQAAVGAHAAEAGRLLSAFYLWNAESRVISERDDIESEEIAFADMISDGRITEREADLMRQDKKEKYDKKLFYLKKVHAINALLGALEERFMPYNRERERGLCWGGALMSLGTLDEKNIGKWRKTRMALLLAELLVGVWRAGLYGRERMGSTMQVEKMLRRATAVQRLLRLVHHYLTAGNSGMQARFSYLLQLASVIAPFFGENYLDTRVAHGAGPAAPVAPALPAGVAGGAGGGAPPAPAMPAAVVGGGPGGGVAGPGHGVGGGGGTTRPINRVSLWKGQSECIMCANSFYDIVKGRVPNHEGVNRILRSTSCGHVFCHPCITRAFSCKRVCPMCRGVIDVTDTRQLTPVPLEAVGKPEDDTTPAAPAPPAPAQASPYPHLPMLSGTIKEADLTQSERADQCAHSDCAKKRAVMLYKRKDGPTVTYQRCGHGLCDDHARAISVRMVSQVRGARETLTFGACPGCPAGQNSFMGVQLLEQ